MRIRSPGAVFITVRMTEVSGPPYQGSSSDCGWLSGEGVGIG
jgi:hypothetical protein